MNIAVIDIGTNTFNLLIVNYIKESYELILKAKEPVKLGSGGITNSILSDNAIERGIITLKKFKLIIDTYNASKVLAFATSALRTANNSDIFLNRAKQELDIDVKIISGQEEAQFIYCGVKQSVPLTEEKVLLLDIGGGSNEFIIADNKNVYWKQSFKLGIARILEKFLPSNPIKELELLSIEKYFKDNLGDLFNAIKKYKIETLIGSSGSFDTFKQMTFLYNEELDILPIKKYYKIAVSDFLKLHKILINSTIEERSKMEGLDLMRIEMIHLSSILVNLLIKELEIKTIIRSNYSLKEGILFNFIKNNF